MLLDIGELYNGKKFCLTVLKIGIVCRVLSLSALDIPYLTPVFYVSPSRKVPWCNHRILFFIFSTPEFFSLLK